MEIRYQATLILLQQLGRTFIIFHHSKKVSAIFTGAVHRRLAATTDTCVCKANYGCTSVPKCTRRSHTHTHTLDSAEVRHPLTTAELEQNVLSCVEHFFISSENGNDAVCDVSVDGTERRRVVKLVAFSRGRVLALYTELIPTVC